MKARLRTWERHLAWLLPLCATAAWIALALRLAAAQEAGIAARSGPIYGVFVQLAHAWNQGWGWSQTLHPGYDPSWHWGGHYGLAWLAAARLSALSDSPWALARLQLGWVGLGCASAWLLGWGEGRLAGGLCGLVLYGASSGVLFVAADDYQDLALCLPLIPVCAWAARRAPAWAFLLSAALLACVREELWPLLPLVGLAGGWRRAGFGLLLALGWAGAFALSTPLARDPPPLLDVAGPPQLALARLDLDSLRLACGGALPWFLLQPAAALAVVGTALVLAQPWLASMTHGLAFSHHYAPIAACAAAGATVVLGRLAGRGRRHAAVALALALASTAWALQTHAPLLRGQLLRADGTRHPAWALLAQVPADAVLYVPSALDPAAARRRWLLDEQSLGVALPAARVTHAIVPADCGVHGRLLDRRGDWALLAEPRGLPGPGDPLPWGLEGPIFRRCRNAASAGP